MTLNRFFSGFSALGLIIVFAVGFTLTPAVSQTIRAALVRTEDEPGRNPYQERMPLIGPGTELDFSVVPAGKRLVVTHVSAQLLNTQSQRNPDFLSLSPLQGTEQNTLEFVTGSLVRDGRYTIMNSDVRLYIEAGNQPVARFQQDLEDVNITLSGYYVNKSGPSSSRRHTPDCCVHWVNRRVPRTVIPVRVLNPDPEQAGARYEQLRHKLILYFAAREYQHRAEELADRTIDAVARRLQGGVQIYTRDISSYCYGVAQNVLRDHRKGTQMEPLLYDPAVAPSSVPERERHLRCLDGCLEELPLESRHLIQSYYRDEKQSQD